MATLDTVTITGKRLENSASFSLSKFRAGVGTLVRPNLFNATLVGYSKIQGGLSGSLPDIKDTFSFRCEKAELPGRTLATADDAVGGGPALKLPYDVTYNDITLSIICSDDMAERNFFEQWIDRIIGRGGRSNAGLVSYYSDYAVGVSLIVDQLNEKNQK